MLLNACWLFTAITFTQTGFVIGLFVIIALLVTCVVIMNYSTQARLNVIELISLRIAFSIYAGWLTTATILNTILVLIGWGLNDSAMNIDETWFGVAILITAEVVYMIASF